VRTLVVPSPLLSGVLYAPFAEALGAHGRRVTVADVRADHRPVDAALATSRAAGWPVRRIAGGHLLLLTAPELVAAEVTGLARALAP